jgi:4'-phosphopantetheinyl transferase
MDWSDPSSHPSLSPGELHVWRASLDTSPGRLEAFEASLSADEMARAARRRTPELRDRFTAGRGLLRALLGRYLRADPRQLVFRYGLHGKPALSDNAIRFNLSHSHGLSLFAFAADVEVGIDLERIRAEVPHERLARRFFTASESDALRALPADEQCAAFFRLWTRKEAYIKACGRGLSLPMSRFEVSLGDSPALLRVDEGLDEPARWCLHALDPAPGYAGTLAVEGEASVRCYRITPRLPATPQLPPSVP